MSFLTLFPFLIFATIQIQAQVAANTNHINIAQTNTNMTGEIYGKSKTKSG